MIQALAINYNFTINQILWSLFIAIKNKIKRKCKRAPSCRASKHKALLWGAICHNSCIVLQQPKCKFLFNSVHKNKRAPNQQYVLTDTKRTSRTKPSNNTKHSGTSINHLSTAILRLFGGHTNSRGARSIGGLSFRFDLAGRTWVAC